MTGWLLLAAGAAYCQETLKPTEPKLSVAISGRDLYREYCAVCHGANGHGDGPAAHALKTTPTDLTRLAQVNHGRFPEAAFLASMRGEHTIPAHGSNEMPIWGSVFSKMSNSPEMTLSRLHALMNYIEDMQVK